MEGFLFAVERSPGYQTSGVGVYVEQLITGWVE